MIILPSALPRLIIVQETVFHNQEGQFLFTNTYQNLEKMKKRVLMSLGFFLILNLGIICMSITNAAPEPGGSGGSECPNISDLKVDKVAVNNGDVCSCPNDSKLYAINTCNYKSGSNCNEQNCTTSPGID